MEQVGICEWCTTRILKTQPWLEPHKDGRIYHEDCYEYGENLDLEFIGRLIHGKEETV